MGFDWESMLDAEGANLDLAYSDLVANALELPADYMSSISDYEDNQEEESPAVDTSLYNSHEPVVPANSVIPGPAMKIPTSSNYEQVIHNVYVPVTHPHHQRHTCRVFSFSVFLEGKNLALCSDYLCILCGSPRPVWEASYDYANTRTGEITTKTIKKYYPLCSYCEPVNILDREPHDPYRNFKSMSDNGISLYPLSLSVSGRSDGVFEVAKINDYGKNRLHRFTYDVLNSHDDCFVKNRGITLDGITHVDHEGNPANTTLRAVTPPHAHQVLLRVTPIDTKLDCIDPGYYSVESDVVGKNIFLYTDIWDESSAKYPLSAAYALRIAGAKSITIVALTHRIRGTEVPTTDQFALEVGFKRYEDIPEKLVHWMNSPARWVKSHEARPYNKEVCPVTGITACVGEQSIYGKKSDGKPLLFKGIDSWNPDDLQTYYHSATVNPSKYDDESRAYLPVPNDFGIPLWAAPEIALPVEEKLSDAYIQSLPF